MFWKKAKKAYSILPPPIHKPIRSLNKNEAQAYFEWYIGKLEERIEYLQSVSGVTLDYSPESLIPIWGWFLKNAEIEKTPEIRMNDLRNQIPTIAYSVGSADRCEYGSGRLRPRAFLPPRNRSCKIELNRLPLCIIISYRQAASLYK